MSSVKNARIVEIFLIEDNPGDVFLTKKAFQKAKIANHIHVAQDGEIAMEMLKKKGEYKDFVTPDIILLDINLPKKNGKQILEEIKADSALCRIPVVILTSSKAEKDILESYNLQASSYIIKPIDLNKFQEIVSAIENFWFSVVVLPNDSR